MKNPFAALLLATMGRIAAPQYGEKPSPFPEDQSPRLTTPPDVAAKIDAQILDDITPTKAPAPTTESRQVRRARERAELKAQIRKANRSW